MGIRLHMMKEYWQTTFKDANPSYKGTCYDYTTTVRYFPKIYFAGDEVESIREWILDFFDEEHGITICFGEVDTSAPWEAPRKEFVRVKKCKETLEDCIKDAIDRGFATDRKQVIEFINDAIKSKSEDGMVRLEWW